MAYSRKERAALKGRTLPSREELIPQVHEYIARSGMNMSQFAQRIGYSLATLHYWFNNQYDRVGGNDNFIRARIVDFMAKYPIEPEVTISGILHDTENARLLRQDFYLALDHAKIIVRHGNPGTQKTGVSQFLIAELNRIEAPKNGHGRRAYRIRCGIRGGETKPRSMTPVALLRRVAKACGVPTAISVDGILDNLRFHFRSRRVLLIFDEAQFLSVACLEVIRELNDEPPFFGLLLLGSHDLPEKFQGFSMEQWRSRLHVLDSLPGIQHDEALDIIRKELPWMKKESAEELIDKCYARDEAALAKEARAQGVREIHPYVSARELFWNIAEIKQERASK